MVHGGKETNDFMEEVVYANLGHGSRSVRVGPGRGLDNGVVSVGRGRVMILTVDPMSAIPGLGMRRSAWLSVHLIASDYTASGCDPELALFSYNFPETMGGDEREEYVREVGAECKALGVAIAGGHTGSYPGAGFTVIGAGSMIGFAPERGYLTPSMARAGDSLVMTKCAAIEATASLALSFPAFMETRLGPDLAKKARDMYKLCTTVRDARLAREVGLGRTGITSMHDATEGGVLGAMEEMASASAKAFVVDSRKIPVPAEVKAVCSAFDIDPLATMGEGALLITCAPTRVSELCGTLGRSGIPATEIGRVKAGGGLWLEREGKGPLRRRAARDPYWAAYDRSTRRRLE